MGKKAATAAAAMASAAAAAPPPSVPGAVKKGTPVAAGCNRIDVKVGPVSYWYDLPVNFQAANLKEMIEAEPQRMRGRMTAERIILAFMTGEPIDDRTHFAENVQHQIKCTLAPIPKVTVANADKTPKTPPIILKGVIKPGNPTSIGRYFPKRTVQNWATEDDADIWLHW